MNSTPQFTRYEDLPLEKRIRICTLSKAQGIPVIIQQSKSSSIGSQMFKPYVFQPDNTIQHVVNVIKIHINISSTDAVFVYTQKKKLLTTNQRIEDLYNQEQNKEDGLLYLYFSD